MEEVENEDSVEETINGTKFVVTRFRALEATRLQFFIAKLIGPTIGNMLGAVISVVKAGFGKLKPGAEVGDILELVKKGVGDLDLDGDAVASAIEGLLDRIGSEEEYIAFIKRILKRTQAWVGGQMKAFAKDNFDNSYEAVFGGKTFTIIPVIALVLRANYPDFLSVIGLLTGGRIQRINTSAAADTSSRENTNESGTLDD